MPGGPLLAAYVLERTTDVDEDQQLLLEDEKAEEEEEEDSYALLQTIEP
jgi:hypothetical protein